MALQKAVEDNSGNSGDYWDIVSIHVVILDDAMEVRYELYKDKAAKDSGKRYMEVSKNITISPIPSSMASILTAIEAQVKVRITSDQQDGDTPFFDDAVKI